MKVWQLLVTTLLSVSLTLVTGEPLFGLTTTYPIIDLIADLDQAQFHCPLSGIQAERDEILVFQETFDDSESSNPTWAVRGWQGRAEGGLTVDRARSGSCSLYIQALPNQTTGVEEGANAEGFLYIPIEGNVRYRFEGYVLPEELEPVDCSVYGTFYVAEQRETDPWHTRSPIQPRYHLDAPKRRGTSAEWFKVEFVFMTDVATKTLKISASLGSWGKAKGRVFVDDISLWKLPSPGMYHPSLKPQAGEYKIGLELRSAIAVPCPSALQYSFIVPPNSVFRVATGVPRLVSLKNQAAIRFRIEIDDGRRRSILLDRTATSDDPWKEQVVDLDYLANQQVSLSLTTQVLTASSALETSTAQIQGAFWAYPRLTVRPNSTPFPSAILISIDTLRADHVGGYGYLPVTTPTLDRLAKQGITFLRTTSASPWTLPSHASLLTSTFPTVNQADDQHPLPDNLVRLPELLSQAGYFCGAVTSHIYVSETYGFARGFDTFITHQDDKAEVIVTEALTWLRRYGDQPFFLFLHFFDPHWNYQAPHPFTKMLDPTYDGPLTGHYVDSVLPFKDPSIAMSDRDLAHVIARYDGEIRYCDSQIRRLLEGIQDYGYYQNTLIIVTADHGEEFREHGSMGHGVTLYNEQLHVPLIISGGALPSHSPRLFGAPVRTVDLAPTLISLLGLTSSFASEAAGQDLTALTTTEKQVELPLFAETQRFGLQLYSLGLSDSKTISNQIKNQTMMFDLALDPQELHDCSPEHPELADGMKAKLDVLLNLLAEQSATINAQSSEQVVLSPEQQEILQSLGYLE